eukprot:scaffold5782_cov618-Prasinococcus_capsulatus_cf.AAC.17
MKVESLVIVYQNDAVNTSLSLVHTARHTLEERWSPSRQQRATLRPTRLKTQTDGNKLPLSPLTKFPLLTDVKS